MQRRVRNVSSLVMGRLVRAAAVEQANKGALATYFCKSSKGRQLQQLLIKEVYKLRQETLLTILTGSILQDVLRHVIMLSA